jgi:hypothetical protein
MDQLQLIEEYPIPFDKDEIIAIQHEQLDKQIGIDSEDDIIEGVDEFHDKYIDQLLRTDEWIFFRNTWNMYDEWIYVWNHQLGYGFKFDSDWEVACGLVDAFDQFTDEYSAEDFEPHHYAWEIP